MAGADTWPSRMWLRRVTNAADREEEESGGTSQKGVLEKGGGVLG